MNIDREQAREAFAAYVAPYDPANPLIALKVAHTYRVADIAAQIAASEGFSPTDADLAWLCGLLHDIGRFEQVRRWGTFRDADSTSHALLGAQILFGTRERLGEPVSGELAGTPRIRDFTANPEEDELIRAAVAYHSDLRLPEGLAERTRSFCNITRDADKIDIVYTVSIDTVETIIGCSAEELLASPLSPITTQAFNEHRCMLRAERIHPADFLVSLAVFAFELVYPSSRRIMAEQNHLIDLLERPFGITEPFRDEHTRSELARMASELRVWLAES